MAIVRVDADKYWNGSVAGQILRRRLPRENLALQTDRIFEVNDDRICATGGSLCKTIRPVTRDEKERAQFHRYTVDQIIGSTNTVVLISLEARLSG